MFLNKTALVATITIIAALALALAVAIGVLSSKNNQISQLIERARIYEKIITLQEENKQLSQENETLSNRRVQLRIERLTNEELLRLFKEFVDDEFIRTQKGKQNQ